MKIHFVDFWGSWNPKNNWFTDGIMKGEKIEVTHNNPDIVVYTPFGNSHKNYNCKKIFWTGENVRPKYDECDLALTFDYDENEKNIRLPLYAVHYWNIVNEWGIANGYNYDNFLLRKKEEPKHQKFCTFIYGNGTIGINQWGNYQDGVQKRNDLFNKLNAYKKVDSAGSFGNNVGYYVNSDAPKINFIKNYKFTFAIENSSFPGYSTEKMMDPLIAHSVPIYWGNPRINEEFDDSSFINCHNFVNNNEIVEYIKELDNNKELYDKMYYQPVMEKMSKYFDFSHIKEKILSL